eukprot:scaffold6397_cov175-Ochromonas_danica.AAC.24
MSEVSPTSEIKPLLLDDPNMLKDQLVALSLEFDDKCKIESLLKRNVAAIKEHLPKIEEKVKERCQAVLQEENRAHEERCNEWTAKSRQLMEEKEKLLEQCKSLVEAVKENDRNLATEARALNRQAEDQLEQERKSFKASFEERQQKFLASKAAEFKASTEKALEPEFARLQALHERELDDVQSALRSEERKLRELFQQREQSQLEEEKALARNELSLSTKALQDRYAREIDSLLRDHRRHLQEVEEEGEKEMEKARRRLAEKAGRLRSAHSDALLALQSDHQKQLVDLKKSHLAQLEEEEKDHHKALHCLQEQLQREIGQLDPSSSSSSTTASPHPPSRTKRRVRGAIDEEFKYDDDEDLPSPRSPLPKTTITKPSSDRARPPRLPSSPLITSSSFDVSSLSLPLDLQEKLEQARAEAIKTRDKTLQAEIRGMEAEILRLEREWRAKADQEKSAISATTKREEEQLERRCMQLTEEIADYVVEREQIYQSLQTLTTREGMERDEVAALQNELQTYKEKLSLRDNEAKDKENQQRLALRELQLQYVPIIREMQEECEDLRRAMKKLQEQWEEEMGRSESLQAAELARLDATVKKEVASRDQEMAVLREALDEEQVRKVKLTSLLTQYSSSTANEPAPSSRSSTRNKVSQRGGGGEGDDESRFTSRTGHSTGSSTLTGRPSSSTLRSSATIARLSRK